MNHFFPTLYQHMYEMEDGHTESGGAVRYAFDENVFPQFSWRGYAILSRLQVGQSSVKLLVKTPCPNFCLSVVFDVYFLPR